ncbi:MAG: enoyl-CoA hydratase/isomerase family protein [Pseudomonadota bacterium]
MTEPSYAHLTLQHLSLHRSGQVMTVRIDTGNNVNALNTATMQELRQVALALKEDTSVGAVVLTGQTTVFSAGMDLRDPALAELAELPMLEQRRSLSLGPEMCAAWEALDAITIVAIEGHCIGGGLALAVACDWRVAGAGASLLVPELKLGMNMSWQSVPRFVSLIGPARTKRLLLLAESVAVDTAVEWGLVDYLAPAGDALRFSQQLAAQAMQLPPVPLRMAKQAINKCANALNDASSFMDLDQFLLTQSTADAAAARQAFTTKPLAKE